MFFIAPTSNSLGLAQMDLTLFEVGQQRNSCFNQIDNPKALFPMAFIRPSKP